MAMASIRTKRKILAMLTIARATPARLMGLRSSMRERCQGSVGGGAGFSVAIRDLSWFRLFFHYVCLPGRVVIAERVRHDFVVEAVLVTVVMQSYFSIPPGPVHRIHIWVKEDLVEVPDDDGQGCQDRLIEVDRGSDIEPPARHVIAHENFGPQHHASHGHDHHAPDQRPVFSLLRVVETRKLRLAGSEAEIVGNILPRATDIVQCGEQIANQFTAFTTECGVEDVIKADANENHGSYA